MKKQLKNLLFNISIAVFAINLFEPSNCLAQINFVQNSSFEDLDTCPYKANQIYFAKNWDTLQNGGGADLFSKCTAITQLSSPLNAVGYEFPRSGISYIEMGLFCQCQLHFSRPLRDYARVKLNGKLTFGETYCTTFYICLTERANLAIDNIGAYFDNGNLQTCYYCPAIALPQVISPSGVFMTDTMNWMKVQGSFIATGNESYLTIGNFKSDSATNFINVPSGVYTIIAEYYFDDVSVVSSNSKIYGGKDTSITQGDTITLGATTTLGLPCEWYDIHGNLLANSSIIKIHPTTTTKYVVRMDLCGNISYDTVQVNVSVGINEVDKNKNISIYPNPTEGKITIQLPNAYTYTIVVTDLSGKELNREQGIDMNSYTIQLNLSEGLYFVHIENEQTHEKTVKKLTIQY